MLHNFLERQILEELPFEPTEQQGRCIEELAKFCTDRQPMQCMLLKGYAGTGKTSVVSALVRTLKKLKQPTVLLAPTGRAAKVLAGYSQHEATSIHKKIYRQKSVSEFKFLLDYNRHKDTLFIVDEASMIGDSYSDGNIFGSGRLLDDLIEFVYSAENCRMILLGDTAQLLPVGQDFSPALDRKNLEKYSLEVREFLLTDVVRQARSSGILANATHLRELLDEPIYQNPQISTNFPDVVNLSGADLIDSLNASYNEVGVENTVVITRSNKRASQYNQGIRNSVLLREEMLANSDLMMVVKNNYFWAEKYEALGFIANGDIARISRIRSQHEMYGFRFADITLELLDYDLEVDCKILVDSLLTATPKDNDQLNKNLFTEVEKDYENIKNRRKKYLELRQNEYLNALQIKFGYAITCHKSQGGQWADVYIDCGYLTDEMLNREFLQWLYTAFTRCQRKLYLVNFKKEFLADC